MQMGRARRDPTRYAADASAAAPGMDKHALYQQAVQYPPGDISWMCKFYTKYIGLKAPCHLREDFCGTAYLSATWCRQNVCRTATGVDIDKEVLQWGQTHNTDGCQQRLCLVQANVLQPPCNGAVLLPQGQPAQLRSSRAQGNKPILQQHDQQQPHSSALVSKSSVPSAASAATEAADVNCSDCATGSSTEACGSPLSDEARAATCPASGAASAEAADAAAVENLVGKPADIICAFNFSVCLLHKRSEVLTYFKQVRGSICSDPGGLFVCDLMGGHGLETVANSKRTNFKTGVRYTFEQEKYNPLSKMIRCNISLQDPMSKRVLRRAFTYHWRLWSVSDVVELLKEAGFQRVAVWVKPMKGSGRTCGCSAAVCSSTELHSSSAVEASSSSEAETADSCDHDSSLQSDSELHDSAPGDDSEDDAVDERAPYLEYNPTTATAAYLNQLAKGWTAYVVGVVLPQ